MWLTVVRWRIFCFHAQIPQEKPKADSPMWKVLRTAYSWRERLYGCRVNKDFERLTTIEHIDI